MLKTRILTAIIGIPLLIFTFWVGSWLFLATVVLIALMMSKELGDMLANNEVYYSGTAAIIGIAIFMLNAFFLEGDWLAPAILAVLVLNFALLVFKFPAFSPAACFATISGTFYIGLMLSYLVLIRGLEHGFIYLLFLFICIWCSDSGAYFTGRFLGKTPLAAKVSPKKTIEGLLGGLFFSLLCAVVFYVVTGFASLLNLLLLSGLISLIGVLGDLVESALKRHFNVKDSSNLLPGHGGFLDRFDSIVFSGPLLFGYLLVFVV